MSDQITTPLDVDLLTREQSLMGLAMMNEYVRSHHARVKALIAMIRLRTEGDDLAAQAMDEWEANEDREFVALGRALTRLPDIMPPDHSKPSLN